MAMIASIASLETLPPSPFSLITFLKHALRDSPCLFPARILSVQPPSTHHAPVFASLRLQPSSGQQCNRRAMFGPLQGFHLLLLQLLRCHTRLLFLCLQCFMVCIMEIFRVPSSRRC